MIRLCAFADEAADSLEGQIEALTRSGISLLELRSVDKTNVSELTDKQAEEIAKKLKDAGISVWSAGSPLGKVDISVDFAEYEKVIRRTFRTAKILGASRVRMFSFYKAYGEPEKVFSRLAKMAEIAKEYGLALCHENEKDIYGDTCARTLEILSRVPALKCVYDPANFLQVGEDPDVTIPALCKKADYFHIKDVVRATRELVPAGEGDGQIARIVAGIDPDRDTVLTVEPHLKLFSAYAGIDKAELKTKHKFGTKAEAFDAAVAGIKKVLTDAGWREERGGFVK